MTSARRGCSCSASLKKVTNRELTTSKLKQFQYPLTSALSKPRVRPRGVPPTHRLGLREPGPVGGDELAVGTAGVGDLGVVGLEAVPDVRTDRRLRRGGVATRRFCMFYRFVIHVHTST